MMVWVEFLDFPIEFYPSVVPMCIASKIRKPF
ncbi:hypothetical protein LINGRAHAP2_LOCUS24282 [Linum grandiflorum]